MPSYEEALRDTTTTTSANAATEPSTTTENALGNGAINGNATTDNRLYRNAELDGCLSGGIDGMSDSNMQPCLEILSNDSNEQPIHQQQREEMNRRHNVQQLPLISRSNDNIDMDETPTSENSNSITGRNSLSPLQVCL